MAPTKGPVKQHVQGGAGQPFFASDDVRDAHVVVVDDVGQMVGRQAIRLHQHLVVKHAGFEGHLPANGVVEGHVFFGVWRLETDDKWRTRSLEVRHFMGIHRQAVAQRAPRRGVVLEHVGLGRLAQGVEFFRGVKRFVRQTLVHECFHGLLVQFAALALAIRPAVAAGLNPFVRAQPTPRQGLLDVRFSPFDKATLVGVFHAQDEGAAMGTGEQPVVQRRPDAAHVERPGGAGCKAYSNVSHGRQRYASRQDVGRLQTPARRRCILQRLDRWVSRGSRHQITNA